MDIDLCYIVGPIALTLGLIIGRYTKRQQGIKDYHNLLSSLGESQQEAAKRKIRFSIYYSRFHLLSRFILCLYLIFAGLLTYHRGYTIFYENYLIVAGAFLILFTSYASTLGVYWVVQDSDKKIQLYKQQIEQNKSKLMKDLGQEVIEALKENAICSKTCKERTTKLEKELKNHQWLINQLKTFQWCDGCTQGKACTSNCGPKFFAFTKKSLQEFKALS